VTVETLGEEHVPRHLAGDRCVHLLHLVLDERVPVFHITGTPPAASMLSVKRL
jgi:hypothetical protein